MCLRKWEQQHQHAIGAFLFLLFVKPSLPLCYDLLDCYWTDVVVWLKTEKLVSSDHFNMELVSSSCFLEQPARSDSSLCIYINILVFPLWEHDICAVDFHKSVTSEKRLLMSPWLKLLISDLFKESSFMVLFHHVLWKTNPDKYEAVLLILLLPSAVIFIFHPDMKMLCLSLFWWLIDVLCQLPL